MRHRNTARGHRGPLLHSREFQEFLTKKHSRGQWSTEQDLVLGIKSGLRDTDVCSRALYTGEGLSLKLSMKAETVNEARYSMGLRKEV
jgi:hypothetical protein